MQELCPLRCQSALLSYHDSLSVPATYANAPPYPIVPSSIRLLCPSVPFRTSDRDRLNVTKDALKMRTMIVIFIYRTQ